VLRAVQMPKVGGDTCFASSYAAYEALSPAMQEFLDGMRAGHDITGPLVKAIRDGHSSMDLAATQAKFPPVEHNVVVTHPDTGRKALFVNRNSTTHIVGLSHRENEVLLPFLNDHVRSPEFQCRLHWESGTVAFWDNRSMQHYAVADYHERRVMHRCTVAGENAR
jgi:taurine dioxygenase